MSAIQYWLMKSEPETFSLEDLASRPGQTEPWDGIRNYQARNFLRDRMRVGDAVLFYHSNCPVPGVAGLAEVVSGAYPDPTAFDPASPYHDPKSDPENPRWMLVDVGYRGHLREPVSLKALRGNERLANLRILQKGNRLSITPVEKEEYEEIVRMGGGVEDRTP